MQDPCMDRIGRFCLVLSSMPVQSVPGWVKSPSQAAGPTETQSRSNDTYTVK